MNGPSPLSNTLQYLRDSALLAHLDGNGFLVNHLASIALINLQDCSKAKQDCGPTDGWAWAMILPLYWLADSYMLREVEDTQTKVFEGRSLTELENLLHSYLRLVRESLEYENPQQKETLLESSLSWTTGNHSIEFDVLLFHLVELIWFREPSGTFWNELVSRWITRSPATLARRLDALKRRLEIQTSLTVLGAPPTADLSVDETYDTPQWVPRLWNYKFECAFNEIEGILESESVRQSNNATLSRILFDARHSQRWRGHFGDPQAIGLTRRRLTTISSPELLFEEVRVEQIGRIVTDLFSGTGSARDRFAGFSLTMLLELSALRRWDMRPWQQAVEFQSRLCAEVILREPEMLDFADRAVRCGIRALDLNDKENWSAGAIARLEFLPKLDLKRFLCDVLNARPLQYHQVQWVLTKLGDAIPDELDETLAQWTVKYVHFCNTVDRLVHVPSKIEFLAPILSELKETSGAWPILYPVLNVLFSSPTVWQTSPKHLAATVLRFAPLEFACASVSTMLLTKGDEGAVRARWEIIASTISSRPNIGISIAAAIVSAAPSDADRLFLFGYDWARPLLAIDQAAVRNSVRGHLASIIATSILPENKIGFDPFAWGWKTVQDVVWIEEDRDILDRMMAAISNESVQSSHANLLLQYIRCMVINGPCSFASAVLPKMQQWLRNPPTGVDIWERNAGIFSIVSYKSNSLPAAIEQVILLASEVRQKQNVDCDFELIEHVLKLAAQPPVGATGAASYLTLELAAAHSTRRAELFSAYQSFLLAAQMRSTSDPELSEDLMDSFRAAVYFASTSRADSIPDTHIRELVNKIDYLIITNSNSRSHRVRGQIAALLVAILHRSTLTLELRETLDRLANDPRRSVRRFTSVDCSRS